MKIIAKIPAKLEQMEAVLDEFDTILEQNSASDKVLYHVRVSIEEIFTNIVSYAYEDRIGDVEISYDLENKEGETVLCVSFRDWGKPYDPLKRPDPDFQVSFEERAVGGLGVYMVKMFMDHIEYQYKDGCNILTIYKKW